MSTLRAVPPAPSGAAEAAWIEAARRVAERAAELRAQQEALRRETEALLATFLPWLPGSGQPAAADLPALLQAYERSLVRWALAAADNRQRPAAALLGILPTTLNEKMKRLGIPGRAANRPRAVKAPLGPASAALP